MAVPFRKQSGSGLHHARVCTGSVTVSFDALGKTSVKEGWSSNPLSHLEHVEAQLEKCHASWS